jgi:predicted 3-demethylubiquinone-9 3-methyltransferase (glyoxalase superfamily)
MKKWKPRWDAHQETMEAKLEACLEKSEAWLREVNANQEVEVIAQYQEVHNEEAEVETVGALQDRYGDSHLAIGRG